MLPAFFVLDWVLTLFSNLSTTLKTALQVEGIAAALRPPTFQAPIRVSTPKPSDRTYILFFAPIFTL